MSTGPQSADEPSERADELQEPIGPATVDEVPDSGGDVFRDVATPVAASDVEQAPATQIAGESVPTVRGEWDLPEPVADAPAEQTVVSFEEFYLTHFDRLVAAIQNLCRGDFHLAQDVVQRTFMKIYQRPEELAEKDNPYGWVLTIAVHVALDIFRAEGVRATREYDREILRVPADEWEECTWIIALQQLPVPERHVMFCRFVLHYDRKQTAAELGMSRSSVDNHTARAVRRLRKSLGIDEEG